MKHYARNVQENEAEIRALVESMKMAILVTTANGRVESGVFNPVLIENRFFLHLNRTDTQFKAMASGSPALLIFFDFLANIPSYWVHQDYGGAATSYYRFAEFTCIPKTFEDIEEVARLLQLFMDKYQSEGGYAKLDPHSNLYQKSFETIGIVELEIKETKAKWKLGQNYGVEKRLQIASKLEERGDSRAAAEVRRWIQLTANS